MPDDDFDTKIGELKRWLLASGARFDKVCLRQYAPEGRDLRAVCALDKGAEAIFIPRKCIIGIREGKECSAGRAVMRETTGWISNHTYLAIRILSERALGEKSFFYPWIRVLPTDYKRQGMPQYWSADQKRELRGSKTLVKCEGVLQNIREMWGKIKGVSAVRSARWTLEDFKWARFTVLTRTFGCNEGGKPETMMVPLADMANHDFQRPTRWDFNDAKAGFTVRATRSVCAGEALADTYGSKGNDSFLPIYGFCVEKNPWNQARFPMPLRNVHGVAIAGLAKLHASKCAYDYNDGRARYIDASCDTQWRSSSQGGRNLLSYARAAALRPGVPLAVKDWVRPISAANEAEALSVVRTAAQSALRKFDSSLEDDLAILADEKRAPRGSWYRNAVLARSGEKTILGFYVRLADTMIPLLALASTRALEAHAVSRRIRCIRGAPQKDNFGLHAGRYLDAVVWPLVKDKEACSKGRVESTKTETKSSSTDSRWRGKASGSLGGGRNAGVTI